VRLTFDPVLTSTLDEKAGVIAPRDLKPLGDVIPSLPPGKRIAVMFDIFHARDPAKYPDRYDVTARFYAAALRRQVTDDCVIDLGVYRNVLHSTQRDVHDVHEGSRN
jgi:hypothetical protein